MRGFIMRITRRQLRQLILKETLRGYRGGRSPVQVGFPKRRRKPDEWYISIVRDMSFEQAESWLNSLDLPETHVLYFLKQHPDAPYEILER
jgi:hypothetical protein